MAYNLAASIPVDFFSFEIRVDTLGSCLPVLPSAMRVRSWSLLAKCTLLSCVLIQTAVRGEEDSLLDISDEEIHHSSTRT